MKKAKNRKILKVVVDRDLCIGAAPCVVIAQKAFALDKEGKAVVLESFLQQSDDELLIAAQSCPVSAIKLFDKDNKQVFP